MDHLRLNQLLEETVLQGGRISVLAGAGLSAESGIPTFRGPEGYWTVGSRVYQPHEMATRRMFQSNPIAVWQWYLYRLEVCRQALPNKAHHALVTMEQLFPDSFALVTQNVDNLHLRAGQSAANTYEVHGNIGFVRCSNECGHRILPMPDQVSGKTKNEKIIVAEWQALHCPACGHLLRPHVLWFDEAYNERYYRAESAMQIARETSMLIVAGTSGATNLPNLVVSEVYHHSGAIIDINIASNPLGRVIEQYPRGISLRQPSGTALPEIVNRLKAIVMAPHGWQPFHLRWTLRHRNQFKL